MQLHQIDWLNRPNKKLAREEAEPSRPVRSSMWLPGNGCVDVIEAYEKGLLVENGKHILVERNPLVCAMIKHRIRHIPIDFTLVEGELNKTSPPPLDYAHFDFMGCIKRSDANWIANLSVKTKAEINFTFGYEHRRKSGIFFDRCKQLFENHPVLKEGYDNEFHLLKRYDPIIAIYQCILRCLLRKYSFKCKAPVFYRDSQRMVMYRFYDFAPIKEPQYPDLILTLNQINQTLPVSSSVTLQGDRSMSSATPAKLVDGFQRAIEHPRLLAGWKRSCTVYCVNRSKESGTPPQRYLAAIKMRLTKNNCDISHLTGYSV